MPPLPAGSPSVTPISIKLGLVDHNVDVLMTTQKEFGAKAQRPSDSRMSCAKFENTFNVKMKDWSYYLDETLAAE